MLEELWKKLPGVDEPETEAEVTGVSRFVGRRNSKLAVVKFRYKDQCGGSHRGLFRVNDYSSIYNLSIGDKTRVRYSPRRPDRYWSDERGIPVETPLLLAWAIAAIVILSYILVGASK